VFNRSRRRGKKERNPKKRDNTKSVLSSDTELHHDVATTATLQYLHPIQE
jgi:hypothetical protein